MPLRPRRIWAIARRDWRAELKGRQGLVLPAVAFFILGPVAVAPPVDDPGLRTHPILVSGEAPDEVLALERVQTADKPASRVFFEAEPDGRLTVHAISFPKDVRHALDDRDGRVRTELLERDLRWPDRSLFLALIGASILTGAISQTIPGERTSRSLDALLTAAISRRELVLGKWLAWTLFGAGTAVLAALVTVVLGHQAAGPWLLALPWVAGGTVALGLFLVRKAADVIGGATVALRVLPAALTALGLGAYALGQIHPLVGAALPLGGALVAAGAAWDGWAPALVATASTASMCALALDRTARDLGTVDRGAMDHGQRTTAVVLVLAALAWWTPMLGPELWALGGNEDLVAGLDPGAGVLAGGLGLALAALLQLGRARQPAQDLGLVLPRFSTWFEATALGFWMPFTVGLSALLPAATDPRWHALGTRVVASIEPSWAHPGAWLLAVVAQEALFRGWLRQRVGDAATIALSTLVLAPADPLRGLLLAATLTLLARRAGGSIWPGVLARLVAGTALLATDLTHLHLLPLVGLPLLALLPWLARGRR